jgi:hypothetical protein
MTEDKESLPEIQDVETGREIEEIVEDRDSGGTTVTERKLEVDSATTCGD